MLIPRCDLVPRCNVCSSLGTFAQVPADVILAQSAAAAYAPSAVICSMAASLRAGPLVQLQQSTLTPWEGGCCSAGHTVLLVSCVRSCWHWRFRRPWCNCCCCCYVGCVATVAAAAAVVHKSQPCVQAQLVQIALGCPCPCLCAVALHSCALLTGVLEALCQRC